MDAKKRDELFGLKSPTILQLIQQALVTRRQAYYTAKKMTPKEKEGAMILQALSVHGRDKLPRRFRRIEARRTAKEARRAK